MYIDYYCINCDRFIKSTQGSVIATNHDVDVLLCNDCEKRLNSIEDNPEIREDIKED